ncbi:hypothetical protein [Herbaspirillum robiniae]|uniref:Uncharacterized protein n=2 Tax=Herbaspirillum robiniae TaxID=2014887 RepID=A0ABX2LQ23_9BURK|nr:hypothetical protein [Herbaspirillum robiniae]NUU00090.1 hypothetical protein [Herbaspirillum robiniae]
MTLHPVGQNLKEKLAGSGLWGDVLHVAMQQTLLLTVFATRFRPDEPKSMRKAREIRRKYPQNTFGG